jgi:hypothetical protein
MTISLPDSGDGSRRRRREETKRRKPRRWLRGLAVVVLLAVLVGAGAALVMLLLGDDDGGGDADGAESSATSSAAADPGDGPGLLVVADDAGLVYGVTLFQPSTGAVVHVPPGTLVEVASMGLVSLREAYADGGVELLQHSLENLLGVRFAEATAVTAPELAAAAPGLTVAVADAVQERDESGRVVEVVPAGELAVDETTVVPLLQAVGEGSALDRIVRHQAFWTAFLASDGEAPLDAAAELDGDAQQRVLPVEAVAGLDGDEELYRVVTDDVVAMVGRLFPDAPRAGADRIRVRILNGVGSPGVAQQVQPLLLDAGGQMTLSGNADRFDYETTQVVYYDDEHLADAESVRDALGVGEIVKSRTPLDVVDVTVVVGADFLEDRSGG